MQINPSALNRLRQAQLRSDGIATIFEAMSKAIEAGATATEFVLGYQHPDDPVAEGDLVPVIVIALRPAAKPAEAT